MAIMALHVGDLGKFGVNARLRRLFRMAGWQDLLGGYTAAHAAQHHLDRHPVRHAVAFGNVCASRHIGPSSWWAPLTAR
jgi:hypothetical protein